VASILKTYYIKHTIVMVALSNLPQSKWSNAMLCIASMLSE